MLPTPSQLSQGPDVTECTGFVVRLVPPEGRPSGVLRRDLRVCRPGLRVSRERWSGRDLLRRLVDPGTQLLVGDSVPLGDVLVAGQTAAELVECAEHEPS